MRNNSASSRRCSASRIQTGLLEYSAPPTTTDPHRIGLGTKIGRGSNNLSVSRRLSSSNQETNRRGSDSRQRETN